MTSLSRKVRARLPFKTSLRRLAHRCKNFRLRKGQRKVLSCFHALKLEAGDRFIEFDIRLNFGFAQGRTYQYSKLYYNFDRTQEFHESRVICFHPLRRGQFETVRLALPREVVASGLIELRIDGIPYSEGTFDIRHVRTVSEQSNLRLAQSATWSQNRQDVREQILESEKSGRSRLPHYPESISLELTPRCNLRCPHCSSHGTPELHKVHNSRPEMSPALMERIAHEVFPHITALSLVGRGEPTLASDELWSRCTTLVREYGVKISCVTNGHLIKRRFTPELIPYVDELCVSIDGNSQAVHGRNRGGSSFDKVLENIAYFNQLRQDAQLARRPKLSFYWTLMKNNVHELPEFIRESARFDPDYFAIRHLVVFHDKDREQSLIGQAEKVNPHLEAAYRELGARKINFEAPPLADAADQSDGLPEDVVARVPLKLDDSSCADLSGISLDYLSEPCTWMFRTGIISCDGEVTTCGKHYGELVGKLSETTSFFDVWNGPSMESLRAAFNTPRMWKQCRECWLRELQWHSQRVARDSGSSFDRAKRAKYSAAAWDYRAFSDL